MLNSALSSSLPDGLDVKIDVHLTRSHVSDEPDMMRGVTELLADHRNSVTITNPSTTTPGTPAEFKEKRAPGSEGSSAGNSTLGSANASREKLEEDNEKKSRFADFPKISGEVAKVTSFRAGRAGVAGIMREEVAKASTSMGVSGELHMRQYFLVGMLLISVCGPLALSLDTRAAVREVYTAQNVYKGQAPIELSVEKFGW